MESPRFKEKTFYPTINMETVNGTITSNLLFLETFDGLQEVPPPT